MGRHVRHHLPPEVRLARALRPARPGPASVGRGALRRHRLPAGRPGHTTKRPVERGRELFVTGCSSCHGLDGRGVDDARRRRPGTVARALRGRLRLLHAHDRPHAPQRPGGQPGPQGPRLRDRPRSPHWSPTSPASGDGPPIPDVDIAAGDLAVGGVLYRENCQAVPQRDRRGRRAELRPGRPVALAGDPHPGRRGDPHRTGPDAACSGPRRSRERQVDSIARYVRLPRGSRRPGRPRARPARADPRRLPGVGRSASGCSW